MTVPPHRLSEFLRVAKLAAREAGDVQRAAFRRAHRVEYKSPDDVVTEVDRRAEAVVADRLLGAFPSHRLLAEESGERGTGGDGDADPAPRWIVDPLDGTTNFVRGIAHFAVSIALEVDGDLALGVVYHTAEDDLYTAVAGGGAFLDGTRLWTSPVASLDRAVVALEFHPADLSRDEELAVIAAMADGPRRTRHLGSAASELAMVARGTFDGLYGTRFGPWDVAAGRVLVEEAGGTVTKLEREGPEAASGAGDHGGRYVVSNGRIHDDLLDCVAGG